MEYIRNCLPLSSLPDISKWNTSKCEMMMSMFGQCSSLSIIPNISKCKCNSVRLIFDDCLNTLKFPKEFINL